MLTVRLLIYLVIAMVCMIVVKTGCAIINQNPESNKPWIIVVPAVIVQMIMLVSAVNDLFS